MLKRFLPILALVIPLAACMTLEGVEKEAQRIQLEAQEAVNAIERDYFEGKITLEERERLKVEAIARAQEDIAGIPAEARRLADLEAERLKQRGGEFSLTLLQMLLLALGIPAGVGAASIGLKAAAKKKSG